MAYQLPTVDYKLLLAIVGYEVGSKGFGICVYVSIRS